LKPLLIIVSGPTASGKTALSLQLAQSFNAEIVSADSRQFYRKMDIGTAKASKEEQAKVPHHFIDLLDITDDYNAGAFESDVIQFLDTYYLQKSTAIMVGGSGLYINAVKNGFDPLPSSSAEIREKWSSLYHKNGLGFLKSELEKRDPEYYQKVDLNNHQRLQRALEAIDQTGETFTSMRKSVKKERDFRIIEIQIMPDRELLYERINERVDQMMSNGLLEEVKSLHAYENNNAMQTVGYRELFAYLNEDCDLDTAIDKVKQHTRNFAKRQFTWFKKNSGDLILTEPDLIKAMKQLETIISV
jgi:tRNA dimethylallyltransferase